MDGVFGALPMLRDLPDHEIAEGVAREHRAVNWYDPIDQACATWYDDP